MNPWVGKNYFADNVKMAVPPAYWLARLYEFDPDLVVLPSRQRPFAYVLARKARRSAPIAPRHVLSVDSDTGMCAKYRLVPVSLIIRHGITWTIDNLLADLRARDTWRQRDMAAAMDETDAAADKKRKQAIRSDMWHRAGDAWRSYQARTGQRTKLKAPVARSAGTGSPHVIQAAAGV